MELARERLHQIQLNALCGLNVPVESSSKQPCTTRSMIETGSTVIAYLSPPSGDHPVSQIRHSSPPRLNNHLVGGWTVARPSCSLPMWCLALHHGLSTSTVIGLSPPTSECIHRSPRRCPAL